MLAIQDYYSQQKGIAPGGKPPKGGGRHKGPGDGTQTQQTQPGQERPPGTPKQPERCRYGLNCTKAKE